MPMDNAFQPLRTFKRSLVRTQCAINATAGTGLAEAVKTAFAATAATALLRNGGANGVIRPKYLRLVSTVAPASGTAMHCRIALDTGTTRYSSGGTALTVSNRDMTNTSTAAGSGYFGALVTGAASASVRYVSQSSPSVVIPVVGDQIILAFGAQESAAQAGLGTLAGTTARQIVVNVGPMVIGTNQEMIIHTWYPSNASTPASWEFEFVWQESAR